MYPLAASAPGGSAIRDLAGQLGLRSRPFAAEIASSMLPRPCPRGPDSAIGMRHKRQPHPPAEGQCDIAYLSRFHATEVVGPRAVLQAARAASMVSA